MTKKLAGIFILSALSFMALGQDNPIKKGTARPDIPGVFVFEFGINRDLSGPDAFSPAVWGSRTVNLYYKRDFRLWHSPISIVPGIGLGLERWKMKNNYTFGYNSSDQLVLIAPNTAASYPDVRKSMLITNYLEIPVEIQYSLNPDDPSRSLKIAVGGRVGYLFDSFTKVKYKENSEIIKLKNKQDYNLNPIRYGLTGRVGFGGFSLFCYYNLSPLFEKGKGLQQNNTFNDFNTLTFGISVASF